VFLKVCSLNPLQQKDVEWLWKIQILRPHLALLSWYVGRGNGQFSQSLHVVEFLHVKLRKTSPLQSTWPNQVLRTSEDPIGEFSDFCYSRTQRQGKWDHWMWFRNRKQNFFGSRPNEDRSRLLRSVPTYLWSIRYVPRLDWGIITRWFSGISHYRTL
jgi:hypothetical protein